MSFEIYVVAVLASDLSINILVLSLYLYQKSRKSGNCLLKIKMCASVSRLKIHWPNGAILPVAIEPKCFVKELLRLLHFATPPDQRLVLLYENDTLDHESRLYDYGIYENADIKVIFVPETEFHKKELKQIDKIYLESLRLCDIRMSKLKAIDEILLSNIPQFYEDITERLPFNEEKKIGTEPLPKFWENESESEDSEPESFLSNFSSVSEACDYFSNQDWPEWMW